MFERYGVGSSMGSITHQEYVHAVEKAKGPTVYNKWCKCRVPAIEVLAYDETYQNSEFRETALKALINYYKDKQQQQTQGGRPDLGSIGNAIRDRAGSDFSKDMFENYWLGKGDLILSQDRFLDIWGAADDFDSKGMRRKGTEYILPNGAKVYAKQINFYKSDVYKNAFGTATLIFDTNDVVVGFYDYYNFNSRTSRSWDAEIKTRSVREASRFSNAMPFRIGYGVVPREIFTSRD
ncbi:MAG: hypothetical protein KF763_19885 [Cyclobacteriaceae bacterium]|nr:hypothetical protein [Cyclobacteriaceae bacterium]